MSGKEYYIKHKDDNCHINTKKYFRTPEMVHKFLSTLKRIDKRPIDRSFEQTIRSILRQRPTSKNPMDWMVWKNKLLQEFEPIANIPDDLCELMIPTDSSSKSDVSSTPYSAFESLPLPLMSPVPLEPHFHQKLISNDPDDHTTPLGFPVEVYLWKDIFSPIAHRLDHYVCNTLHEIIDTKELQPFYTTCEKERIKLFSTSNKITPTDTYVYFITGGFAYRTVGTYLKYLQPDLPVFEDILQKAQDYDMVFILKSFEKFPTYIIFDKLESFCEQIYTKFHSTWNKRYSITKNGIEYDVQFIKPSPCTDVDRQGIIHSDYRYIHDRFLIHTATYAVNNNILNITYRIELCIQITTPTERYCVADHLFEIHLNKEDISYNPLYEMQQNPWFPSYNVVKLGSQLANKEMIHSLPSTKTTALHQFQFGKYMYQLPNVNALLLQSMNAMVLRIATDKYIEKGSYQTYKARQDYARIYTILRMLETIPDEPILTKKEIQYIYTTLQSITMQPNWKSLSDAKKHAMIQQYKDAVDSPSKRDKILWKETRIKATVIDKQTKKPVQLTEEYYKGPYEECRINPKEEDPLLWELGVAKFNLRRAIMNAKLNSVLPEIRRKSCDGTAPVKRRTVKKRSTGHKTRKHRSI